MMMSTSTPAALADLSSFLGLLAAVNEIKDPAKLKAELDRVAAAKVDLHDARATIEQLGRELAAERSQLANERERAEAAGAAQDRARIEADAARVALKAERDSIDTRQTQLDQSDRQLAAAARQVEGDRAMLAAERAGQEAEYVRRFSELSSDRDAAFEARAKADAITAECEARITALKAAVGA